MSAFASSAMHCALLTTFLEDVPLELEEKQTCLPFMGSFASLSRSSEAIALGFFRTLAKNVSQICL
jgi:hypothetical protein